MIQLFLKTGFHIGHIVPWSAVALDGKGNSAPYRDFGVDAASVVVPVDGTFRHLSVYSPVGSHQDEVVTLYVNGVATAVSCVLAAADTQASDTQAAPVVAGDDVYVSIAISPFTSTLDHLLSLSLEFEGDQQFYAVAGQTGSQAVGLANHRLGGVLGNGVLQDPIGPAPTDYSSTRSICAVAGTITGSRMKAYAGAPGTGVWTAYLAHNTVLQDGTGGTVDTACVLTGEATQAATTFALPISPGDHLEWALVRSVTPAPFATPQVALSVTFTPTDATSFMCTGGSNDANSLAVDWKWVHSQQVAVAEDRAQCPVGPRGLTVTGLYVEASVIPGMGTSHQYTIRKNATDTPATVTIADLETTGSLIGVAVPFAHGELIDLQITPVNGPSNEVGLWWGLALTTGAPPAPSYTVDTRAIRRLRRAPHVAQENVRLFYRKFELDLERGQGLVTGQGEDPMVLLRISRDGGQTWGEEQRLAAGKLGAYTQRVIARRLGQARDTVFEVVVSDPIAWSLVGAWLDLEAGTS